jgi:NOL1/NOP2/fmu family ribosome biogenesis protein
MFLEQAFVQVTSADASLNVLDLCSAPGGKSTHLASLINADSLLVSNEVIRSRVSVVAENLQKWGALNTVVTHNDPKDFQRLPGFFDVIIVDAPCSGEGLFRKDHNAMKEWSTEQVGLCSSRQRRILNDIWPALKGGGVLIYSTCTYNEAENEDVLDWLNESHEVEFVQLALDKTWGIKEVKKNNTCGYRFFPHTVRGEGFFISVMRKVTDEKEIRWRPKNIFASPVRKIADQLNSWIKAPEEKRFIVRNDQIVQCLPSAKASAIELLSQHLYLISAGTTLATIKHDKLIPEHAGALSVELNLTNFNWLDLDLEEALKYLRKESVEGKGTPKGFALVRYKDLPLGWVNVLDSRVNNLYPSERRIRMAGKTP